MLRSHSNKHLRYFMRLKVNIEAKHGDQSLLIKLSAYQNILPRDRADKSLTLHFIEQCIKHSSQPIVSTSFGPQSGVLLYLITQVMPNIPVIWVDSGYNIPATYRHAENLTKRLQLNLQVYTPNTSAGYWDANRGGIPTVNDSLHRDFTITFKLDPFQRALKEWQPDLWFSSIRRDQTGFRAKLKTVHLGPSNIVKAAPLYYWQTNDLQHCLAEHNIVDEQQYFDPIKAQLGRECGLHKL